MAERNFVVSKSIVADNVGEIVETTVTANTATTVASFPLSDSDTVEFTVKATQGDRRYSSKALALHNGTTVDLSQYGELSIAATEAVAGTGAVTWVTRTSNFSPSMLGFSHVLSVDYGDEIWVAAGEYGDMRTSTDAVTWTTATSNFGYSTVFSVAYGDNQWVAGGVSGEMRTSTDAITWTTRTSNFGNSNILSIAYGNNLWVAGGFGGAMRTSTDTVTWVTRTSTFGTTDIFSVAYGNNLWVAGGAAGQLRTSTDAITWVTRTSNLEEVAPFYSARLIFSVAYGNNLWVAGASYGEIRTSTDAITWVTQTSNFDSSADIRKIEYGNNLWVAVGGVFFGDGDIRTSTDAVTWVTRTSNISNPIRCLAYGDSIWAAGGYYGQLRTSAADTASVEIPLTLSADISGSDVRLRATITDAATTNAEVKVLKTTL